jgi:lysozyme family protein
MADFDRAILKVLRHEGVEFGPDGRPVSGRTGYVNHPDDPGGETHYGVTRKVALENGYAGPMRDIPYTKVLDIYRRRYWDDLKGDEIPDQEIAEELLDAGVNCSPSAEVRLFSQPGEATVGSFGSPRNGD